MRLLDMLGPQERARRKGRVATVPEVFIIESLELGDERKARREEEVLASVLRMCGKNRRLFVSACSAGNAKFAKLVRSQNKGVISVAAPAKDIQFDHAVAFWSSFYVKTFSTNSRSMSSDRIAAVLRPLANLFGEPVHLSRKDKAGKWIHGVIGG